MKFVLALLMIAALVPNVALADTAVDDEEIRETIAGGPWVPGPLVPCAKGIVTSVGPRLDEPKVNGRWVFSSGVMVEIRLPSAPKFLNGQPFSDASVVHYQDDRGNGLMQLEKPGDIVQVCLVSFPTPRRDPQSGQTICDPNKDGRGMIYRVYDYKRRAAYVGQDSEHGCGGA
jgi:hypothetical protein